MTAKIKPTNAQVKTYIATRYTINPVTGCWNWNLAVDRNGYPYMSQYVEKKSVKFGQLHRLVYKAYNGKILKSTPVIRHTCNNRGCINPAHLICGTTQQNVHDAIAANTHISSQTKGGSVRRRFNDHQRADIRTRIAAGESYYSIAKYYLTSISTIRGYALRDEMKHNQPALSDHQKEELIARIATGKETGRALAKFYGIKESTVAYYKHKMRKQAAAEKIDILPSPEYK